MTGEHAPVDWTRAWAQIAAADRALDEADTPGPERLRRIWGARARALAAPEKKAAPGDEETEQLVVFSLARERYGVSVGHVLEIQPIEELTPVPHTPRHIAGILIVRGRVLTALDLRALFELPPQGLTEDSRALVVQAAGLEVALLADEVLAVSGLAPHRLEPPLAHLSGMRAEYLRGVTPDMIAVLDLEALLADRRLRVHEEIV